MPELPEVETVVRGLRKAVVGRRFRCLRLWQPVVVESDLATFKERTVHVDVVSSRRRGKWILLDLSNQYTVLAHLRMTGKFEIVPAITRRQRHDHLQWTLDDGTLALRFNDQRRFGRFRLVETVGVEPFLQSRGWGPEPFEISEDAFAKRLGRSRRSMKAALLDQRVVAGLGNIYADEILFAAGIHPATPTLRVGPARRQRVFAAMLDILLRAIEAQGTSLRNFVAVNQRPGSFREELQVFRRDGQPCPACGATVAHTRIVGRSTHYCPRCQHW
jgi:formamidopyrimidine-DNA glycosylase